MDHADQHFDRRRLAGPIASQKAKDGSLGNVEAQIINHAPVTVILREPVGGDGGCGGGHAGFLFLRLTGIGWLPLKLPGSQFDAGLQLVGRKAEVHGLHQQLIDQLA